MDRFASMAYLEDSIEREIEYVEEKKREGVKIAGIYCEYTPRELLIAAGAVPICLCGTSNDTIADAERILPSNLCPLIKSSFGYFVAGTCPFINMADIIIAETTCDGKKKMYEIMSGKKRMVILELPQKQNSDAAFRLWVEEIKKLKEELEDSFGVEITDCKLEKAIRTMNEERALLKKALYLGARNPPVVSGAELALLRFRVAGMPGHLKMLELFISEAEKRIPKPEDSAKPRILLTGCPTGQGSGKIIDIIEESGGIVVCQEACSGIKSVDELTEEMGDPLTNIARRHFNIPCSCMTPNRKRFELIERLAGEFAVDAVVDLVWQACHTYNVESHFIAELAKNKLHIPYLKIETDYSHSDSEQIKVRVGTMLDLLKP